MNLPCDWRSPTQRLSGMNPHTESPSSKSDDLDEMLGITFRSTPCALPEHYLRHQDSRCATKREPLDADTQLMMEINAAQALSQAEHESSEVLPHGFSSDSLQQQDSIDPSFRIPATHVQSPVQQLRRNLEEGFSGNNGHHSPDRQSPDKVKKKGGGQGPRLRKACDACSKRKVKVRYPTAFLWAYQPSSSGKEASFM